MCCNFPTIKITEGNAFTLIFPLKRRSYVAERPIDEDIDAMRLTDVRVTLGGVEYAPTIETYGVRIDVPATLARGTYDGLLTADYDGNAIRGAYESCVQIVAWNSQSNAQQYILGSPVATKAAYVLGYMPTDEEVESLKQQLREQIEAAERAETEAIAEKERYAEAIEHLDDIAQESTLTQGVSDIRNDIANIDIDIPTDYAKETTALQAAADAAAAKVAAQTLSPIALAAEAYNTGKVELAANITAKGVEASASETLPQLAQKVTAIAQQPIILSPSEVGDMYAVQQFGSLTTPNYWNLYEVLNTLLNDGRLQNYGGILLAEYYRDYDILALSGAGAGGAYVVSDIENGAFKMYTEDTTHIWNTEFDGKGNRWVAYCFANEYHDFQITDTNTSPRSIFIGRKVGTITSLVAGRANQIVIPDGNELKDFVDSAGQNYAGRIVLRNIKEHTSGTCIRISANVYSIYCKVGKVNGGNLIKSGFNANSRNDCSVIVDFTEDENTSPATLFEGGSLRPNYIPLFIVRGCKKYLGNFANLVRDIDVFIAEDLEVWGRHTSYSGFSRSESHKVFFPSLEAVESVGGYSFLFFTAPQYIYFGYKQNDKTKSIQWLFSSAQTITTDIELKEGYCKPIDLSLAQGLTKENVQAHIFDRLGVNDLSTGAVTITLNNAVLNLFTQEEIDAVVARTNITIVGA